MFHVPLQDVNLQNGIQKSAYGEHIIVRLYQYQSSRATLGAASNSTNWSPTYYIWQLLQNY